MDAIKLLGSLMNNKSLSSELGSQLLGGLLGGGKKGQQSGGSGLAGLLGGALGGGGGQGNQIGNILGLLGKAGGQGGGSGGGIGALIGSVLGGAGSSGQQTQQRQPQATAHAAPQAHHADANEQAILMIRAMVNAAKSDGRVDEAEQKNIISKLGDDVSDAEVKFLKQEFAAPLDVKAFARSVPSDMAQQIYAMSLTSIELDTQNEAQYLGQLAQGLKIQSQICNQIHEHLGAPKIFN